MTKRCGNFILDARYKYTFNEIAKMTGLHRVTIARLLTDDGRAKLEAELLDARPVRAPHRIEIKPYVPWELAVDEIFLKRKRKYITIIDREVSRLIDILATNGRSTSVVLDEFFETADNEEHYPEADIVITPARITMDMCYAYREYFYEKFPKTKIVLDRWHVDSALTRRFKKILNEKKKWYAIGSGLDVRFETTSLSPFQVKILYKKFANIHWRTAKQGDTSSPREELRKLLLGYPHIISGWEYRQRFDEI
jgi:hypothetical protein